MAIKSNWENCKSESITKDLMNICKRMEEGAPKKFIPTYPAWVRNYSDKFGLVEGKNFMIYQNIIWR